MTWKKWKSTSQNAFNAGERRLWQSLSFKPSLILLSFSIPYTGCKIKVSEPARTTSKQISKPVNLSVLHFLFGGGNGTLYNSLD